MKKLFTILALVAVAGMSTGCATSPYRYGVDYESPKTYHMPEGEEQIEIGRPNKVLDAMDWIWPYSLLGKLMLWNRKVDSHQISDETVEAVRAYLAKNEMKDVKIRFNQYAPLRDWRRLVRNKAAGGGYRYTFGVFMWLNSTLNPFGGIGRINGGDHYNPLTDTVNIFSDIPAVALHECGHAKDFAGRKWKGTYALTTGYVPFLTLYPEAKATGDAVGYLRAEGMLEGEKAAYKILYPAYTTYIMGESLPFVPTGPVLGLAYQPAGIVFAHIFGRAKAATVRPEGVVGGQAPQ